MFHSFSLWLVSEMLPALSIHGGWTVVLFAGLMLGLLMLLVAPMLKILFIPINIITFGLMSWMINVIVLWLLTIFVPNVTIQAWTFPGATWAGFVIPSIHLSYGAALVAVSLAVSFFVNVFHDISEG